uniref:Serpentine receptor class gamma n=1 Tax=Meloidogyne enterolobii TaxID=390850 RepID=A0A6V7W387_MELEN|nr:unnamed protein product [Meloidogyne enterolobii]
MVQTYLFIGYTIFEWITIVLYIRLIYVLFTDKLFNGTFYRFIIIIGISNLLNYLIVFFFYNLPVFDPLAPFFDYFPSGYLIGIVDFIVFYTAFQQDVLYTSICLNRFTAVWEPFKQQTRWKKWWIWHVLFAHIVPLPLTIHILFSRGLYVPLDRYNPGIEKVPILLYYNLWEVATSSEAVLPLNGQIIFVSTQKTLRQKTQGQKTHRQKTHRQKTHKDRIPTDKRPTTSFSLFIVRKFWRKGCC